MVNNISGWAMIVLAVISLCIGMFGKYILSHMQAGTWIRRLNESTWAPVVRDVTLFVFMVGIPFAALVTGVARLDLMALGTDIASPDQLAGFTFANWMRAFGIGAFVAACALFVLWVGTRTSPAMVTTLTFLDDVKNAVYDEVHWTFYRVAPAMILGDTYAGAVIGSLLVMLEWLAVIRIAPQDGYIPDRVELTLQLASLLVSAFLYLMIQNLVIMVLVHIIMQTVGNRILMRRKSIA
jgi:hypothetical protein